MKYFFCVLLMCSFAGCRGEGQKANSDHVTQKELREACKELDQKNAEMFGVLGDVVGFQEGVKSDLYPEGATSLPIRLSNLENELPKKVSKSELIDSDSELSKMIQARAEAYVTRTVTGDANKQTHDNIVVTGSIDPPPSPNVPKDHSEDITKLRAEIAQLKTQNKPKDYSEEINAVRAEVAARLANTVDRFRPQQPQAANGVLSQVVQDFAPKAGAPSWYRWVVPQGRQPELQAYYMRACACGRCQQQCFWGVVPPERMPIGFPQRPAIEYDE